MAWNKQLFILVKMTSDTVLIANGCWKVNGGGSAGQYLAGGRRHRIIYKDYRSWPCKCESPSCPDQSNSNEDA